MHRLQGSCNEIKWQKWPSFLHAASTLGGHRKLRDVPIYICICIYTRVIYIYIYIYIYACGHDAGAAVQQWTIKSFKPKVCFHAMCCCAARIDMTYTHTHTHVHTAATTTTTSPFPRPRQPQSNHRKGWGGWGDPRDHALCIQVCPPLQPTLHVPLRVCGSDAEKLMDSKHRFNCNLTSSMHPTCRLEQSQILKTSEKAARSRSNAPVIELFRRILDSGSPIVN